MTKIAGRVYKTQPTMTTQALSRRHKYAIGQTVTLLKVAGPRLPRKVEETNNNEFEITRLLPEQGPDFLYRVKNAATAQERVVSESEINLKNQAS
jgi:hypothetical protein